MEKQEDSIVVNITKKDKLYLSIIGILLIIIVALAVVLPRPYKIVEVEKPIYQTVYKHVYDTKQIYIISSTSALYDANQNYIDANGNEYKLTSNKAYIDTGKVENAYVSVEVYESSTLVKKKVQISKESVDLIVIGEGSGSFGIEITFSSSVLDVIEQEVKAIVDIDIISCYLFEFEFEGAKINYIVNYIK